MFKLSQETIAIVTVGLTLAGLDCYGRSEARADREAIRAEIRTDREAIRAEARADREAFEKHITRLTQEQSRVAGIVEQMRTAGR